MEARQPHTKAEVGLEMILKAKKRGIPFEFVGMDAHYGEQPWLLTQLEGNDVVYVAEVSRNTRVYLEYPEVGLPIREESSGYSRLQNKQISLKDLSFFA